MLRNTTVFITLITCLLIGFSQLLCQVIASKSNTYKQIWLDITPNVVSYKLPDSHIVENSETVISDTNPLIRYIDYNLDYAQGIITFDNVDSLFQNIFMSYFIIPDYLTKKMYQYEMQIYSDSLTSLIRTGSRRFLSADDSKLIITGTKTFSLMFSNQQSFDLKQSLFLKLDGELSNNMRIEGQLSDSQSPLTPEGDSKEISNIDQVYLKLYGNNYAVTFGDQELEFKETALMNYKTKFEGLSAWYKQKNSALGAVALSSGKRTTNIFDGVDGKQGPYYLTAESSGFNVQVIPGSETVSINGNTLSRGLDYTIDYSDGSITFKQLITSNSKIIIDFQYSDEYYRQNMYMASASFKIEPSIEVKHHQIWQMDVKDYPLLWTFSEADKDSLRFAGDRSAWGQGIIEVEPGTGQYIKLIESVTNYEYYQYAPQDTSASYQIYFSFVGFENGDYEPIGTNKYQYKGRGQGSYLPIKKLVPPVSKANVGMDITYKSDHVVLDIEGMLATQDKNTFSSMDDDDNTGFITNVNLSYEPDYDKYKPVLNLTHKYTAKNSFSFSKLTTFQDNYEFVTLSDPDTLSQNQFDANLQFGYNDNWKNSILARYKTVQSLYNQNALRIDTSMKQHKLIPSLSYYGLYSNQSFINSPVISSDIYYHRTKTEWKYRLLTLYYKHIMQLNESQYPDSEINFIQGNRVIQSNPVLKLSNDHSFNSTISVSSEENENKKSNKWLTQKKAVTYDYNQLLSSDNNMMNFSFIHREVSDYSYSNELSTINRKNFDLLNMKSSLQLFDNSISVLNGYQLNQLEFFPKIKELQYVGLGLGQYDSTGVQVTNGDYNYFYINSGQSRMASEINASLSVFYHLSRKYQKVKFWDKFQTESSFQITENTPQRNSLKLYLLYPDELFSSSSTIYGRQMMNHALIFDVWRNYLTVNIRYEKARSLDNRYDTSHRTTLDARELQLNWKNVLGGRLQTSYQNKKDKNSQYRSEILTNALSGLYFKSITTLINAQFSVNFTQEDGNNQDKTQEYQISNVNLNPLINMFIANKYRLTCDLSSQFNRRTGSDFLSYLPDKRNGSIFLWSVQGQYKLSSFTSGSLEYSGKSYPDEETIHEIRMEFRAEI